MIFCKDTKLVLTGILIEKLFLRYEGKKLATSLKANDSGQWTIASLKYREMNRMKQNKKYI